MFLDLPKPREGRRHTGEWRLVTNRLAKAKCSRDGSCMNETRSLGAGLRFRFYHDGQHQKFFRVRGSRAHGVVARNGNEVVARVIDVDLSSQRAALEIGHARINVLVVAAARRSDMDFVARDRCVRGRLPTDPLTSELPQNSQRRKTCKTKT